jgi:hypothetical protein
MRLETKTWGRVKMLKLIKILEMTTGVFPHTELSITDCQLYTLLTL